MAIPSFIFVELFQWFLPIGLGFAAGAMGWLVFNELLPEAMTETKSLTAVLTVLTVSIVLMAAFQFVLLDLWFGHVH